MSIILSRDEEPAAWLRDPLPVVRGNHFLRFMTARVLAQHKRMHPAAIAAQQWPSDRVLEVLTRAAVAPAMTTTAGWAAELAQTLVYDALDALGPASAGAQVLLNGLVVSFDGAATISVPGFVAEFGNSGWVAEGQPIPVRQLSAVPQSLVAHKLSSIAVLTQEMMDSSNAEKLIGDTLIAAAGRMLDEVLFDVNPATAARPKGLRNGIAALTPSNNSSSGEAALEDVIALIGALAPVAGNGPYILVAPAGRAALLTARFPGGVSSNIKIYGTSALTTDLLAIAPAALVAALDPAPDIETSNAGTLHMDTAPTAVGSAAPTRSLFQTNSVALKVQWPITWALRDPRGVAWLTPSWR
jgi:hypothetical protein